MARRKISKASKRRLTFFGTISIFLIIYFFFSLLYNIYNIFSLNIEKTNLEKEFISLQEKSEELKNDIQKLNDKEYLANYAREKYLYSKDDEYIIQLNDDLNNTNKEVDIVSNIIDSVTNMINKNYIILGLSLFMVIIFIYILSKGKKNRNKKEL